MRLETPPPRSLADARSELERLAAELRTLAEHADHGVQSLDRVAELEAAARRWEPIVVLVGIVLLGGAMALRLNRRRP